MRLDWDCKTCSTLTLNGRQTPSKILSITNIKSDSVLRESLSGLLENWFLVGLVSPVASGSSKAKTSSRSDAKACNRSKKRQMMDIIQKWKCNTTKIFVFTPDVTSLACPQHIVRDHEHELQSVEAFHQVLHV